MALRTTVVQVTLGPSIALSRRYYGEALLIAGCGGSDLRWELVWDAELRRRSSVQLPGGIGYGILGSRSVYHRRGCIICRVRGIRERGFNALARRRGVAPCVEAASALP